MVHKINTAETRKIFGSAVIALNLFRWNARKSLQEIWSFELWFKGIFKEYFSVLLKSRTVCMSRHCLKSDWPYSSVYTFPEVKTVVRLCTNTFCVDMCTNTFWDLDLQHFLSQIALSVFEIRCNSAWWSKPLTELEPCGDVGFQSAIPHWCHILSHTSCKTFFSFLQILCFLHADTSQ